MCDLYRLQVYEGIEKPRSQEHVRENRAKPDLTQLVSVKAVTSNEYGYFSSLLCCFSYHPGCRPSGLRLFKPTYPSRIPEAKSESREKTECISLSSLPRPQDRAG